MEGFEVIGLRIDLVILGWGAGGFLLLAVVAWVVAALLRKYAYGFDPEFPAVLVGGISTFATGALLVVLGVQLVPFNSLYHHWYGTTGVVESVTNVFEGGSGEISPGYVVELSGVDAPTLFDDPRVLRAVGEEISVTCSVEWVPSGVDRLNCWIAN